MNKKIFFVSILAALFIFSACNEKYNVGLNLIPNNDLLNINLIDTFDIQLKTFKQDSINTTSAQYLFLGNYNDPIFGRTEASFMTQLRQSYYPVWDDNPILDSICFVIPVDYDEPFYGTDEITDLNLNVYKVTDTLNNMYYSNQDPDELTDYELLGSGEIFTVFYENSDTTSDYPDTVGIGIRLDDDFGNELLQNSTDYFENSTAYFHELFKGIYVECTNENSGIYKLNPNIKEDSKNFGLIIYYHNEDSKQENKKFTLPISMDCSRFNMFSHDYTNSDFYDQLQNPDSVYNQYAYLLSMSGTKVRISIPALFNLDSMIINKAELHIKTDDNLNNFSPAKQTWLVGIDSSNNILRFQDFYSSSYQGASYDNGIYNFNITRIVQNYVDGIYKKDDFDLFLMDYNAASNFKRTILTNGYNSNPPKLVITYTKIK